MNSTVKTVVFWLVILLASVSLWQVVKTGSNTRRTTVISYSQFLSDVDAGNVTRARISGTEADGTYREGDPFRVIVPPSQEQMLQTLRQKNVEVWYAESSSGSVSWLMNLFAPLALLAALWFFMIRQMKTRASIQRAGVSGEASSL
jgi:cell division protease FtsH